MQYLWFGLEVNSPLASVLLGPLLPAHICVPCHYITTSSYPSFMMPYPIFRRYQNKGVGWGGRNIYKGEEEKLILFSQEHEAPQHTEKQPRNQPERRTFRLGQQTRTSPEPSEENDGDSDMTQNPIPEKKYFQKDYECVLRVQNRDGHIKGGVIVSKSRVHDFDDLPVTEELELGRMARSEYQPGKKDSDGIYEAMKTRPFLASDRGLSQEVNSTLAHEGISPKQHDACPKVQAKRSCQSGSGGQAANPHLERPMSPLLLRPPSEEGAVTRDVLQGATAGSASKRGSGGPIGGLHLGGPVPDQVDAYIKAQERAWRDTATCGGRHPLELPVLGYHRQRHRSSPPPEHWMGELESSLDPLAMGRSSRVQAESTHPRRAWGDNSPPSREGVDEAALSTILMDQYSSPPGLASALVRNCALCPLRIWLINNNVSMLATDGRRVVRDMSAAAETAKGIRINSVACTRWEEVSETVAAHANICAELGAPAVFRMANNPGRQLQQQLSVAEGYFSDGGGEGAAARAMREADAVRKTFRQSHPKCTSSCLTHHLMAVHDSVEAIAIPLRLKGRKVAVNLVTDSLPEDETGRPSEEASLQFLETLRKFASLPVWVTIRLSTDEPRVLNYYGGLDRYFSRLGPDFTVNVLDDLVGESREVHRHNPWLNYALPLHLFRESGMGSFSFFDTLDERALLPEEVRDLCLSLFDPVPVGGKRDGNMLTVFPEPTASWDSFAAALRKVLREQVKHWDTTKGRLAPLIDMKELDRIYGNKSGNRDNKPDEEGASKCCTIL